METDEAGEGGIGELSAQREFVRIRIRIVMLLSPADGIVAGIEGLNDDPTRLIATAAPSRYLCQDLEGPLGGAKIRDIQGGVGGNDPDQCDCRKVVSLGDHLRADEDINLSAVEALEDGTRITLPCRRIAVHPGDSGRREEFSCPFLDPLRSRAQAPDAGFLCRRGRGRRSSR